MYKRLPLRLASAVAMFSCLWLASCGGGSSTAGGGGSGVGGTGVTTVTGNVSQIVAEAPRDPSFGRRMFAEIADFVSRPVNAESDTLGDIQVFGGGQITTTDGSGNFSLEDVTPNQNFVLNFTLSDDQTIALPIGEVPAGTTVRVINIVLDTNQGFASAENVEIEEDANNSRDESDSNDDDSTVEQNEDGDSTDDEDSGDDD